MNPAFSESIAYGTAHLTLTDGWEDLSGWRLDLPAVPRPAVDVVRDALRHPCGSPPLRQLARLHRSAAILVPGKARRAGAAVVVQVLLEELNAGGMSDDRIRVFLADGTHVQHLAEDIAALLGPEVARRVHCIGHDCHDVSGLVDLGRTQRGTPITFNRAVLDQDLRILTGRIVPHYFAGFSGGRKALLPGVAGFDTIRANHRLTLADERGIHPGVGPGLLVGNPVHEDMVEAVARAGPCFCVNTILNEQHAFVGVYAGDLESAHAAGCAAANRHLRLVVPQPVDALIAVAGGAPYDDNFMQALKAPFNVAAALRSGGAMLWVAECSGGVHDGFLRWAEFASDDELNRAVRSAYTLTGHNSIMLRQLVQRCRVALLSALAPDAVRRLGLHPVSDLASGLAWLREASGGSAARAIVPQANTLSVHADPRVAP